MSIKSIKQQTINDSQSQISANQKLASKISNQQYELSISLKQFFEILKYQETIQQLNTKLTKSQFNNLFMHDMMHWMMNYYYQYNHSPCLLRLDDIRFTNPGGGGNNKEKFIIDEKFLQNSKLQSNKANQLNCSTINFPISRSKLKSLLDNLNSQKIIKSLKNCISQNNINQYKIKLIASLFAEGSLDRISLQAKNLIKKLIQANIIQTAKYIKQKGPQLNQQQIINRITSINTDLFQWILLYNYTILCYLYRFNEQQNFPYHAYSLQFMKQPTRNKSYIDIKIDFFLKTFQKRCILQRIFRDSTYSGKSLVYDALAKNKADLSINTFASNIFPAKQSEQIANLIKYSVHCTQYLHQLIGQMTEIKNVFLDAIYNSVRFLIINFAIHFSDQCIRKIQQHILKELGGLVYQQYTYHRNKTSRWQECKVKGTNALKVSYQKIQGYLKASQDKKQVAKSLNPKKIAHMKQNPANNGIQMKLIKYVQQLNKQGFIKQQYDPDVCKQTYIYLIYLLKTEVLTSYHIQKALKKSGKKNHVDEATVQKLLTGQIKGKTLQSMKQLRNDFIVIIFEACKVFNLISTLPFYSYQTQITNIKNKYNAERSTSSTKDTNKINISQISKLFADLDKVYIYQNKRFNTQLIKKGVKSDNIPKDYLQNTMHIVKLFQPQNQKNQNSMQKRLKTIQKVESSQTLNLNLEKSIIHMKYLSIFDKQQNQFFFSQIQQLTVNIDYPFKGTNASDIQIFINSIDFKVNKTQWGKQVLGAYSTLGHKGFALMSYKILIYKKYFNTIPEGPNQASFKKKTH